MADSFIEVWLSMPLGVVLEYLSDRSEDLWVESKNAGKPSLEYERLESVRGSLERVVAALATTRPPQGRHGASQALPTMDGKQRARGRRCFKCRMQIRSTSEMVTICPVWMPGLPMHDSCFRDLDREFGGKY